MEALAAVESQQKLTRGRQKIEIKLIENEVDWLVAFTKRRSGIYKKASELSTLCGAKIALIVLSPAGKVFSFAHPSLELVIRKVLNHKSRITSDSTHPIVEAKQRIKISELNQQFNELVNQLEAEKERKRRLQHMKDFQGKGHGWWETSMEELGLEELQQMNESLSRLYENVKFVLKGRDVMEAPQSPFLLPLPLSFPSMVATRSILLDLIRLPFLFPTFEY